MADYIETLKGFRKTKEFFIGIDSDGCAFDTMEIKHKECFIPNIIKYWNLQPVSRFARSAAEFVNLYSVHRGCNRFNALEMVFDLLADWDEPVERGYTKLEVPALRQWIAGEPRLSSQALQEAVEKTGDETLKQALAWSDAVNETVTDIVHGVPPFPHVRESLDKIATQVDIMVVSATPNEALEREWQEHGIDQHVQMICGQELGKKKEHLQYAASGKYDADKILMIGDAPGDMNAAKANNALFYPINPGSEAASWKRFYDEAADQFFAGEYAGEYERKVIDEFLTYLPETPSWKK